MNGECVIDMVAPDIQETASIRAPAIRVCLLVFIVMILSG